MNRQFLSHCSFSKSRGLAVWFLFLIAVLVALYALGVFPVTPAQAGTFVRNPGASELFQAGAGEHAALAGDAPLGTAADPAYRAGSQEDTALGGITPITPTTTLTIMPTFDGSITGDPNATAIEGMINQAIAIYQSQFSDPITIRILFRYSTTEVNGNPLPPGVLARSNFVIYTMAWNTYVNALIADARTSNDTTANASLPGSPLSTSVVPSSAGGRAVGLNTPGTMAANGTVGSGTFDGIITLNRNQPFQFTRPTGASSYDALRSTEHEMDEILGLGSNVNSSTNRRPQDLFTWSAPGTRSFSSSGARYFSINSGNTNIVNLNQDSGGDFGDWFSAPCPNQANPYVQNAFSCQGQFADVTATSPEGINLDVIGYDLGTANPTPTATPTSTPGPGGTVLGNISTRLTIGTGVNVLIGGFIITGTQPKNVILRAIGPSLPLAGAISDTVLELHNSSGALIAIDDDWQTGGQYAEIVATGIPPANFFESAIVATLSANNSAYTAIVYGYAGATGIGLVEVYDLDRTVDSKMANISTRGLVTTGNNVMIGGTIIVGSNQARILLRAIGPSLANVGVPNPLSDTTLGLYDSNGALIAFNDDWRMDQEAEIIATGIPPTNNLESAIVRNLSPASYTAIVSGYNNLTGVALVELYQLQ